MDFPPQGSEKLPRRNAPIPIQPGPLLPAPQTLQDLGVLRVIELVVPHPRRNEARVSFLSLLERKNEPRAVPGMPNPSGIGRRVNPRSPVRLGRPAARRDVLILPARQRCRL